MKSNMNLIPLILISLFACNGPGFQNNDRSEEKGTEIEIINDECTEGKKDADSDFNSDDLGFYFYGLPNPRFNNWIRLMREEYKLKIKGGGDIIEERGDCYNQLMREKIKEKFGEDAFRRIDKKLDDLYEEGLGDREPEFVGGESELAKYIYCNIEDDLLTESDNIPVVVMELLIGKNGKVQNKGVVFINSSAKKNDKYENEAIRLIEQMPNWISAIENKREIDFVRYRMPIRFEKEMKRKSCG